MDPSNVRREWAERSGEYSPEYYAYYGPNDTSEDVRHLITQLLGRDASVLEIGCSSGRHLAHLRDHGFTDVSGVEVNEDAADVMADTYPELAADGEFYLEAIEDVVGEFDDGQFDAVFSVQTLQHVHPDAEWVFEELFRVTDDLLITVENEGSDTDDTDADGSLPVDTDPDSAADPAVSYVNDEFPLYYRDWGEIFTAVGFSEIDLGRDGSADDPSRKETLRAFRVE